MIQTDMKKKILSLFVVIAFVAAVQWYFGWDKVLQPWKQLDWANIIAAIFLFLLTYQLRTWRLYQYFNEELKGHWLLTLRLILLNNILNVFLPMRSGEVSFPLLLNRYFSIDYSRSIPALFWFRLLDLHTILLIGLIPFALLEWSFLVSISLLIIWLLLPLAFYRLQTTLAKNRAKKIIDSESKWEKILLKALEGAPNSMGGFLSLWGLTLLNWGVKLAVLAWVLSQFIEVDFVYRVLGVISGELSSVLPFHAPGGIGTYEAGIVAILSPVVTLGEATQSAINIHLFVLGGSIMGAIFAWFIPHKKKVSIK
jgi:uncharacterized membrane protein YbhN (UPF0104 family)